jgi:UDP-2,3-diacylglucosamine hydrolase
MTNAAQEAPPTGATLFISDVHLGAGRAETDAGRAARLLAFLDTHAATSAGLYVLGDLFDFWFDYRHAIPKHHVRVLARLGALVERGVPVTFFGGNHDFWAGPYLEQEFGVRAFDAPRTMAIDGRNVALMHGDGLARGDAGYKALKGMLRNRWTMAAYRALHPDFGIPFALWVSHLSRHSRDESKVDREWLFRQLALPRFAEGADAALTGHYHHPTHFRRDGRDFLVLGDWVKHSTFASLEGGRFALWSWDGTRARAWENPGVDLQESS